MSERETTEALIERLQRKADAIQEPGTFIEEHDDHEILLSTITRLREQQAEIERLKQEKEAVEAQLWDAQRRSGVICTLDTTATR